MADCQLEESVEKLTVDGFGEWLRKENFSEYVVEQFRGWFFKAKISC